MTRTRAAVAAVAMAALLVLAGCAGPISNGTDDGITPDDGTALSDDSGTVSFYVSDEENAIQDFAHLNVTITKVGFHRAGDGDEGDEAETEEPDGEEGAATESPEPTASATDATETEGNESDETETESTEEPEDDEEEKEGDGGGDWVEYEVNRTVDLTTLLGANATKLGALQAPNGTYDKVFVYVDGINATLENGERVNVKLPSNKLQINKGFTVGNGENVSFVFDISVFKAGNSGKYILKPVVSESGTSDEVDIDDVDEREEDEADENETEEPEEDDENETEEETESSLTAEFQGPVTAGENATLKVSGEEGPVANATVAVDDETVGTTAADGTVTFAVPEDAEDLEVEVTKGDAELELETEVSDGGSSPSLGLAA